MSIRSSSLLLQRYVACALFALSAGSSGDALGYTLPGETVFGDPGCIGNCGGGDTGGGGDWSGDGSGSDPGSGGGSSGDASDPFNLAVLAAATCTSQPETREHAAAAAYRAAFPQLCPRQDRDHGDYYRFTFADGTTGIYQRSDSGCASTHLFFEITPPTCPGG